jgi:putative membrane protein
MVKYNPKQWFALIFQFHKSDTFRILFPSMLSVGIYTAGLTYLGTHIFEWKYASTTTVHSLLGIVLGLILVFRTNTAYDRWWEGRRMWGALVNETRSLAIKLNAIIPGSETADRRFFSGAIVNYVFAVKGHLRNKLNLQDMEPLPQLPADELKKFKHIPNRIANELFSHCNVLYTQGKITGDHLIILDKEIKALTDIIGACERIKNTPIPYSYSLFMKKFIFIYTMTMPFGFITTLFYWTVPVVMFVFYVLVSIELIAEEIEDPFGTDSNDLPMDELAQRIRQNVREILLIEQLVPQS